MIVAVDEAGIGCLAGPMAVCGLVIQQDAPVLSRVRDSKKLSEQQRWSLYPDILREAVDHEVLVVDSGTIDHFGVWVVWDALVRLAIRRLRKRQGNLQAVIDGTKPVCLPNVDAVKDADDRIPEVGAASILAKVRRDRDMDEVAGLFPGYGFQGHKGYGTAEHRDALRRLGPCPIHRELYIRNTLAGTRWATQ